MCHYLFVSSWLCSRLQLLFIASIYIFKFPLFHYLLIGYCVTALFSASIVSSSVYYVTILFLKGFHCFIICLLRHCSSFGFDYSIFCLLCNYTVSSRFSLFR